MPHFIHARQVDNVKGDKLDWSITSIPLKPRIAMCESRLIETISERPFEFLLIIHVSYTCAMWYRYAS